MSLYEQLTRNYRSGDRVVFSTPEGDCWGLSRLEQLATSLRASLCSRGLKKGDRVMVQVAKSVECVALYMCCLRSGFVFVPLNTAYTTEELNYFLQDAEPALLILDDTCLGNRVPHCAVASLSELADAGCLIGESEVEPLDVIDNDRDAKMVESESLACIIYTSGTTGRSKGAALTQKNLLANSTALNQLWGFSSEDILLHALPIFHVHGLLIAMHTAMLSGAEIRFLPQFDVDSVLSALPECTVMMGVPTHYARLLLDPAFNRDLCRNLRVFVSGSAPLSIEAFDAFRKRTGHNILERYGMSETNIIASNPLVGERVAGTVGFALEGTSVRIADENDSALAAEETGAVQVRGPGVFNGYWRRPELTQQEFTTDGYFRTGDLGQMDSNGRLTLVGRSKDLIITGGLNVYPAEIERVLDAIPGVTESAVVGVPDPDFGERVEAFVVSDGSIEDLDKSLQAFVRLELANFKRPKAFHLIESLPRNTMGKIQKTVLRERLGSS